MSETIYSWKAGDPTKTVYIFLCEADSESQAAERIAMKLAKVIDDPELLLAYKETLQNTPPMIMDFSGRVGILAVGPITVDVKIQR